MGGLELCKELQQGGNALMDEINYLVEYDASMNLKI